MIKLTELGKDIKAFGKFELGRVVSNPYARAFAPQVNEADESEDHEVSMAQNQLDAIIKAATELKEKMGMEEKQIPAWIQDHITNSENYITQAASNYHEYGDSNESVNEGKKVFKVNPQIGKAKYSISYHDGVKKHKDGSDFFDIEIFKNKVDLEKGIKNYKSKGFIEESINEAGPCWKGYKQVGMKMKNGNEVPNCVPEGVVKEARGVPKIFVKTAAVEKKIKELKDDRKKAVVPYNKETDPAKKEKLKQILWKLTNQIKGYEKNLIDLRDMEERYIQQMQADVELDPNF